MKQALQVMQWHYKFKVPVADAPTIPPHERIMLRHDILQEEVDELYVAMQKGDLVAVADAIADILYVSIGTSCECGLHHKLEEIFDEVHRSNMSKLDENGNPVFREDGKVLKSKLFSPPNLEPILSKP